MLSAGDEAPDFTLPDQDRNQVSFKDLRGETVVLYFYPRADTSGCTVQACGVRDNSSAYEKAGAQVIGISPDPVPAISRFSGKHSLGFTLLADEDHAVCDAYGTWIEKSMYGKKYWGAARATFIIDADGVIAKAFPKVQPKQHDELVLAALHELHS